MVMTKRPQLIIDGLKATVEGKEILKGLSLSINGGEVHASWDRTERAKVRWLPR